MKVFLNKKIPQVGIDILKENNLEIITSEIENPSHREWLENCKKADLLLNVGKNKYDKEFFDACPNIKAIALFSVGFDQVDISEATKRKIPIGNTPEEFWNSLHDGKIGIKPITKFDASEIPVFNAGEIQDFPFDKYFVKKAISSETD